MKKTIYLLSAVLLGIIVTTWYSCEKDPEESCFQEEICEAKDVTACCEMVDDVQVCVYKYNGKEYDPDTEIDQLYIDLGCEVAYSPSDFKAAKAAIVDQLHALLEKARAGLKK